MFFNSICISFAMFDEIKNFIAREGAMAIKQVFTNKLGATPFLKCFGSFRVHVQDIAVNIANGNGAGNSVEPSCSVDHFL